MCPPCPDEAPPPSPTPLLGRPAAPRLPHRCAHLPELPRSLHSPRRHPRPGQHPQNPPLPRSSHRTASGRNGEAAAAGAITVVIADRATKLAPNPSNSELQTRHLGRRRSVRRAPGRGISPRQRAEGANVGGHFLKRGATTTIPLGSRMVRELPFEGPITPGGICAAHDGSGVGGGGARVTTAACFPSNACTSRAGFDISPRLRSV